MKTALRLLAAALLLPAPASAQVASDALSAPEAAEPARAPEAPAAPPPPAAPARGKRSNGSKSPAPAKGVEVAQAAPTGGMGPVFPASAPVAPPGAPPEERAKLDKLTTENLIKQQEFQARIRAVVEERDELQARNTIAAERLRAEMDPLAHAQRKQQIAGQMADDKAAQELAAMRHERDKLRLQNELAREKVTAEQVKLDAERLKLDAERLAFDQDKLKRDKVVADLDFQTRKARLESDLADEKTSSLKRDLDVRSKKDELKKAVDRDPDYALEPFKDGVLTITDRRIPLNGPILLGTAEFVNDRIDYFNNKDPKLPIFLVIDRSPGGSVMEGYRILKAIRESKAPVHVVVKSYAASMAAVITTLAPRSYAYPNAVILHHQILSFMFGNLTQQKEQLEVLKEWYKRLAEPVAKKSGYSLDAFTKEMYKHNSDGDWEEFADEAQKLRWVDHVVREVRESGTLKEPEDRRKKAFEEYFGGKEETDPTGNRFVRLPRLQPYDAYWIYNRDGYYR
jgi:ATP-dependent Clp protease, protease subunit